jgi:hypothetical protein
VSKLTFNMSVSPFGKKGELREGSGKPRYGPPDAPLHQLYRCLRCLDLQTTTHEDRDPRYLVSFPLLGFGVHVRAAYTPRPTPCPS